jgi:cytochrome oxidase Cu insertion factor (SCO1/SenC/PrrC family)
MASLAAFGCEPEPVVLRQALPAASIESAAVAASTPRTPYWKMLANRWQSPLPIPSFELTNQDGVQFRLAELSDGFVLLGFIFTSCRNEKACPLTTQKMHDVAKAWSAKSDKQRGGRKLYLLTLTFDPENDTPDVLAKYSELLRKDYAAWTFATGPEELMMEVLPAMFDVIARRDDQGELKHTVKVALLGPGLRPLETWQDNRFEPDEVVDLIVQ